MGLKRPWLSLTKVCWVSAYSRYWVIREGNPIMTLSPWKFLSWTPVKILTETSGKTSFLSQAVVVKKEGGWDKCINDNVSEKVTCKPPVDKTVVGQATILFLKQICNSDTSPISISRLCSKPYSPGSTSSLPQPITLTTKMPQRKRRFCKRPFRGSHTTCQITELVCTIWAGKKDRSQTGVGTGTSDFQSSCLGRRGLLFHPASDRRICWRRWSTKAKRFNSSELIWSSKSNSRKKLWGENKQKPSVLLG